MNKKNKKIEKKVAATAPGAKAPELSDKDLDKVAGGGTAGFLKATSRAPQS
jgi:hypothetical protein